MQLGPLEPILVDSLKATAMLYEEALYSERPFASLGDEGGHRINARVVVATATITVRSWLLLILLW